MSVERQAEIRDAVLRTLQQPLSPSSVVRAVSRECDVADVLVKREVRRLLNSGDIILGDGLALIRATKRSRAA